MKIINKKTNKTIPTFGDLQHGDTFYSPVAEDPNEVYMVIDSSPSSIYGDYDGVAVKLASGVTEDFRDGDAVVKVEGTLTIE